MDKNSEFITEPKTDSQNNQRSILRKYVDGLDNKINYAKWKQNLVLTYNYVPLSNILDKIQTQKLNHARKSKQKEIELDKQLNNHVIQQQLLSFKDFEAKLLSKIQQIQYLIEKQQMQISVLNAESHQRTNILKELIRQNMNLGKLVYTKQIVMHQQQYQQPKQIKLYRSRTTSNLPQTLPKLRKTSSKLSTNQNSRVSIYQDNYRECLETIIRALRKMQASQDVQDGIYLDIMCRKKQSISGKYSLKSKICNTLFDRYRRLRTKSINKETSQDFYMQWETFKELNWKQIMGIVLVKDRNADCLKYLLNNKN